MREDVLLFGKMKSLVGIVTNPPEKKSRDRLPAILLLNSGLIHRVGLNRLHVRMARALAGMGFVVLRFDFSGIGDSKFRSDHLPFTKSAVSEIQEAMDSLSETTGSRQFILMGICSGAKASFKTACDDSRVVGAVLINPGGHLHDNTDDVLNSSLRDQALARHYWRITFSSSFAAKNWLKALTGKVDYWSVIKGMLSSPIKGLLRRGGEKAVRAKDPGTDLRKLIERGVRLFHIYSEGDEGLDYLYLMLGDRTKDLIASEPSRFEIVEATNHTFTLLWSQEQLMKSVCNWARELM
jgi:pimeloyl-ACP methyl ester carboxylesterase